MATLKEREKSLALYLRAQKSGVSASTIMNSISEYSFKNNPEKQAAARQKLLRDLQHLKKMGLAESEGVNRHTVWKAPIIPTKIELMDLDAAIAVMTLNVFGELPLDQRTSHRINELLTRASLTLEDSKLEKYRRLTEKIAFKPWVADRKKPTVATELYESVLDAVLSEQFVSLSYKNTSDVVTTKQGSPLGMITSRQIVYLIFFDNISKHVTPLALQRIEWIKPLANSTFYKPADWKSLKDYASKLSLIPDNTTQAERVVVRFLNKTAVRNLKGAPFTNCQQVIQSDPNVDNAYLFTAYLVPNRELVTWLLYFGRHVEVLEPASLRARMKDEAEQMAKVYAEKE